MLYAMYGGVFWIPVVLGLAGLGCVLLFRSVSRPGWLGRSASCGGCGYAIEQVGDGRCPECGASLVHVGILTPRAAIRLRGSAFLLVIGWTLLAGMVALPLLGVSFWLAQESMNQKMMLGNAQRVAVIEGTLVTRQPNQRGQNKPVVDFEMLVEAEIEADMMGFATDGWVEYTFTGVADGHQLHFEANGPWELRGPDGVLRKGATRHDIDLVVLAKDMSLDPEDEEVIDTLVALLGETDDMFESPQQYQMQMSGFDVSRLWYNGYSLRWDQRDDVFGTGLTPREFAPLATGILIFIVYALGLWFFLRRRGRLLRVQPAT